MDRTFLQVGALAGLIGVAFGAFGAHALCRIRERFTLADLRNGLMAALRGAS